MSDILCRWLNEELRLSQVVEPKTLAKNFSSGYLIGEVLYKYQLQNDFSMFTKKDTSISKLNNFTRLEPTLYLLGISLDINMAQALMQEKQGVAARLLYQLYTSLEKQKKARIGGTMMEMIQPAASAGLHKKEYEIYSDRLHHVVKRDAVVKLQKISQHYQEKCQHWTNRSRMIPPIMVPPVTILPQQKRQPKVQDVQKTNNIEKVPKPPPYTSQLNLKKRQRQRQQRAKQAQTVQTEIAQFETNMKKLVTYGFASSSSQDYDTAASGAKLILQSSSKYIQDIQQRLGENAAAREQRERRLNRFMMEQLKAHEAQEEAQREEQLVRRLTRQTQQEQRLVAQLLQIRRQKEVIRENCLFREQQYQQRRERDFQESLEREAALARQAKLERPEEIRRELEFCDRIAAERAQIRYMKHFAICEDILEQMVDLATKVGEYQLVNDNQIPEKQMREWKELLLHGLPLYEPSKSQQPGSELSEPLDPIELKKQEILNNRDYDEYTNMVGEWAWPEEAGETKSPPAINSILRHIVIRLRNLAHQPVVCPNSPSFPRFTLKACVLGKFCSGKSTCLAKIAEAHGIHVLSADTLIEEALNAHQKGKKLATWGQHGAVIEEELKKGNAIPNELLMDIIVEAIRQIPPRSRWILDGFPLDITQAHMLEKALGGPVRNTVKSNSTDLTADPNPPKPPPPPAPALDLAVLLDIPNERVAQRSLSHTDGAATDKTLYRAQIPHRISSFQETWPKLEEWFDEKQNILVRVDADVDEEELYKRLEWVLQAMMHPQKAPALPPVQGVVMNCMKTPDSSSVTPSPIDQPIEFTDEVSPRVANEESQGVPRNPPSPGSSSWVYVDEPLPSDTPEKLCSHWDTMCESYVNNIKAVMQQLRSQHAMINHHLYSTREEYKNYLRRPDQKQQLVSQWQKDFNSIFDDMREDGETKAELHLRLDELCEHLRDISDQRKEEDEKERDALLGEGWLEDHTAILINHHSILLQMEMDRFQATLCILKVYYLSMYSQMFSELPSNAVRISLLDTQKMKDQYKGIPLLHRHSNNSNKSQDQAEPVKPPQDKLISDYEETLKAIMKMVSAEAQKVETKEQEALLDKEELKSSASGNKKKKGKPKGPPSPSLASNLALADDHILGRIHDQGIPNKIYREYAAALTHEENAAKVRIGLVKAHGLVMVHSLQSRAEQALTCMQKWLEEHYVAEMKSIDQLSQVCRHHIEAAVNLQNEVVLDGTEFYLKEVCPMVATLTCRPPAVEKPTGSTPTISQLESLYRQLYTVAPSGLMSSPEFFSLLVNIISVSMGGNILPELWINKDEAQLMEIVSLLMDEFELIDWRWFLLSAAFPWPTPSLMQLLAVLQRFRAADMAHTGYINEEQYLQTDLWFSRENVQPVPEDPSEPLPYDRLANLRRFFFKLFADHSFSPPRLDYVSMLQYFAADPNPRQGFIRALSVVLGQHLRDSSPSDLVKSMPSIKEEAAEPSSSHTDGENKEADTPHESRASLGEQEVSIPALLDVICHRVTKIKENSPLPLGCWSQEEHTEHLVHIFRELGYRPEDCVPFSVLSQHPFIQGLMENSRYQLVNIHRVLQPNKKEGETDS